MTKLDLGGTPQKITKVYSNTKEQNLRWFL